MSRSRGLGWLLLAVCLSLSLYTFDMSGTGTLIIAPGGKLNLYVKKSTSISGSGIVNQTGIPSNFNYSGSKENYQIYYSGTANFIGVVHAPSAKMDLSGYSHFMGASVSAEIRLQNGFQFHYDESWAATPAAWSLPVGRNSENQCYCAGYEEMKLSLWV